MRPTVMQVNLQNFRDNIKEIKSKLSSDCKMMPVIKANAYGTYINTQINIINEFDIVAVAVVCEGAELRKIGYQKEIFVLNQPAISEIDEILENDLTIGVCTKELVKELGNRKKSVKVHIEIDSGMGRTGIQLSEVVYFIDFVKMFENIEIDGIYTHLSSADNDIEYTKKQIEIFEQTVEMAKERIPDLKYIHCSASNGIVNFKETKCNLVRPGMIMYGYSSGEGIADKIKLKPVCQLKSQITFLKTVPKGTSIGYSRSFITKKETKVATISIGYADGLRREMSNGGLVWINGQKVQIIGKVCMDSFMADVTELANVEVGDDVWIWDNENITLEDVAEQCNTINYEIMSTISNRVPREFTEK